VTALEQEDWEGRKDFSFFPFFPAFLFYGLV
jgi:hypothetical protein